MQYVGPPLYAIMIPYGILSQHAVLDVPSYSQPSIKLRGRSFNVSNIMNEDEVTEDANELEISVNFDDHVLETVEQELDDEIMFRAHSMS